MRVSDIIYLQSMSIPQIGGDINHVCLLFQCGVEQSGNIFIFNSSFAGETIRIVVANSVLYISVIGKDGIVEIPENISGEVELQLVRGNVIYHAYVEL